MALDKNDPNLFLRWTKNERIQHWLLAVSFAALVLSGFALKYPDSWWAWHFKVTGFFDLRGFLHRFYATIYIVLAVYHILYLIFTQRGRKQFRALLFAFKDFADLKSQILRNLAKPALLPRHGHFTYWEKIEYWALVWGTLVMIGSGVILWFENISLQFLPLWALDIATVIHFYEAILATLAIIVWHFYFVIFDPTVYPVNFSMFNGFITYKEMEEEHAGELQDIEENMADITAGVERDNMLSEN